ncbi:MAG: sugar ABC transporter ATP-binding protein [Candidatus Limiplasma sp.]|nr:sugar ABC transporter ATP-binding protein [Candidatus Limiplasma sp.]
MAAYRVEMEGICKHFGGVQALVDCALAVESGSIHALVGENGAGKSTLMKVLSGALRMDRGVVKVDGEVADINSPSKGKAYGISIIYQEFELAPTLTVAENIFLDRLSQGGGIIRWKSLFQRAQSILTELGFRLDPRKTVEELSVAYQQVVEIAKALSRNCKILVLDEPTAVLAPEEAQQLFRMLRKLKETGVSVIYISHRLEEVFEIADKVTTMRDGRVTATVPVGETSKSQIIEMMIGRKLNALFPPRSVAAGEEALRVEGLRGGRFADISFAVAQGEVLGFAGLVGSGRTEVVRAIFGADRKSAGSVFIRGKPVRIRDPRDAVRHGLALVPENRKELGLVLSMAVRENTTMAGIRNLCGPLGVIRRRAEGAFVKDFINKLAIKTQSMDTPMHNLSGGNQQKVVLAKWFAIAPKILFLDEPTRGVDVGAKVEIFKLINEIAAQGVAVVMISSEMQEVIGMCDRVCVMHDGRISGELRREELSEINIMRLAVGEKML